MSETFIGMPGVVSNDSDATVHTGGWRTTVTIPEDTLRWGPTFPQGAHRTLANTQMRRNLGHATRTIRTKRGQRVAEMPDWERNRTRWHCSLGSRQARGKSHHRRHHQVQGSR